MSSLLPQAVQNKGKKKQTRIAASIAASLIGYFRAIIEKCLMLSHLLFRKVGLLSIGYLSVPRKTNYSCDCD